MAIVGTASYSSVRLSGEVHSPLGGLKYALMEFTSVTHIHDSGLKLHEPGLADALLVGIGRGRGTQGEVDGRVEVATFS